MRAPGRRIRAAALAALTLSLTAGSAEARFRLRLGGLRASAPTATARVPAAPRYTPVVVGSLGLPTAAAAERRLSPSGDGPPRPGIVTRSVLTGAPPPAEDRAKESGVKASPVVRVAEPWCPTGRVTGSGTGFCLIN